MVAALVQAALRSLILALVVWAGLRIFRVKSVVSQRYAWTAVLIGSLLMPLALSFAARWQLLPAAMISPPASLERLQSALTQAAPAPASIDPLPGNAIIASALLNQRNAPTSTTTAAAESSNVLYIASANSVQSPVSHAAGAHRFAFGTPISFLNIVLLCYFLIAAALFVRLFLGMVTALRLWRSSTPIVPGSAGQMDAGLNVRVSHKISTPVTIGSGIVLPAGYTSWTEEKLRIVLAHERSHVTSHDFHVQILASLYTAAAWFSPLGWWLKHKLSELGEAISDGSGLDAASNRAAYAQVLLEFAAEPRPTLIGVAMARPSSISRRIERLLNDSYLRHAFCGGARTRVAVLVVPAVLFATAAFVRVQAATQPNLPISTATSLSAAAAVPAPAAVPGVLATPAMPADLSPLASRELALATPPAPPNPASAMENGSNQPEATFDRNLSFNGQLDLSVSTASGNLTFTRGPANQIRIHGIVKANQNGDPAEVQQIAANPPIEQDGNTIRIGAHKNDQQNVSISYEIEAPDDTLLNAATASGNVTDTSVGKGAKLTTASGNITATGLEGGFEIHTGSGNISIDKAGQGDARAETGSGNINLQGIHGSLKAETGSGTIKATGTPSSPWKLQTGSGNIELATGSAPMNLNASTGSGRISTTAATEAQNSEDHHHLQTQLNGGGPEVRASTGSGNIRVN